MTKDFKKLSGLREEFALPYGVETGSLNVSSCIFLRIFLHEAPTTLVNDFGPGPKSFTRYFTKTERARSVYQQHVLMLKGYLDIW